MVRVANGAANRSKHPSQGGARAAAPHPRPLAGKLTLLPLVAATYFMVAGGPYGLEDLIGKTGYSASLIILALTPLLWSLPTALMVSELASALPEEGGFYVWVRRGMGRFWGYQEAWLTLAGSVFEMALYPTLFVDYLGGFAPRLTAGHRGLALELAMIATCAAWNIIGARAVGDGSVGLNVLLFLPFIAMVILAFLFPPASASAPATTAQIPHMDLIGGIVIAMWNYMGWDNLSTIAGEVHQPQRTYPLAMLVSVILVVGSYMLPVAAVAHAHLDLGIWTTGGWVDAGRALGGPALAIAASAAGAIGAVGTFAALMLSFTRLPAVMAEDGFLPRVFTRRSAKTAAPWVAILACAVAWAVCLPLGFLRLLILDVLLTGLSILLEFWALVALRIREPNLARPYKVPGGLAGAIAIGIPPLVLVALGVARNQSEQVGATNELMIGLGILAAGVLFYFLSPGSRRPLPVPPRQPDC
jgi:amino acid transporter